MGLLVGHDDVHVVLRTEAVVHDGKETVSIRWEIYADNFGALVANDIKETRILVCKTIMVLSPDDSSQENVEGWNLGTPLNLQALLNPLAVLNKMLVNA